jgi:hypothetical protein
MQSDDNSITECYYEVKVNGVYYDFFMGYETAVEACEALLLEESRRVELYEVENNKTFLGGWNGK